MNKFVPGIGYGTIRSVDFDPNSKVTRLASNALCVVNKKVRLISDVAQIDLENIAAEQQEGVVFIFDQSTDFSLEVVFGGLEIGEFTYQQVKKLRFIIDRGAIFGVLENFQKRKASEGWIYLTPTEARQMFFE